MKKVWWIVIGVIALILIAWFIIIYTRSCCVLKKECINEGEIGNYFEDEFCCKGLLECATENDNGAFICKENCAENNECKQVEENKCCLGDDCSWSTGCEPGYVTKFNGCDEDCNIIVDCSEEETISNCEELFDLYHRYQNHSYRFQGYECYRKVAVATNNPGACSKIQNDTLKYACYDELGVELNCKTKDYQLMDYYDYDLNSDECEENDGLWILYGPPTEDPYCRLPFEDSGDSCIDSCECLGGCNPPDELLEKGFDEDKKSYYLIPYKENVTGICSSFGASYELVIGIWNASSQVISVA